MSKSKASTQQRRANSPFPPGLRRMPAHPSHCLLDGRGATAEGGGHALNWGAPAPSVVNETKAGIVAVMQELGRPTSQELYAIWGGSKPEAVFDYHLSTLVRVGMAEIVSGPELRFRLSADVAISPQVLPGRAGALPPNLGRT